MKLLLKGIILLGILYIIGCLILYMVQEKLLFHPTVLPTTFDFNQNFSTPFEEVNLTTTDNIVLNNLHFKSDESKGVVLFFHGNGGAIDSWGMGAENYMQKRYDVFYTDYRGYGKSGGKIKSESQLINDAQIAYDFLRKRFNEDQIIISGTSIGTGIASQIAAKNNPAKLILNAPYYSLTSLIQESVPIIPPFLIKYKLNTARFIEKVKCPIYIFHGDSDDLIKPEHAKKLKRKYPQIELNIIEDYGHNDLSLSPILEEKMKAILN